jgi:hypothetical protein
MSAGIAGAALLEGLTGPLGTGTGGNVVTAGGEGTIGAGGTFDVAAGGVDGTPVDVASWEGAVAQPARATAVAPMKKPNFDVILFAPHLKANWGRANQSRARTSISRLLLAAHLRLRPSLPRMQYRYALFCH